MDDRYIYILSLDIQYIGHTTTKKEVKKRMAEEETKKIVREGYAKIAKRDETSCCPEAPCCGSAEDLQKISKGIGYTGEDLKMVPEGANLGLGCGNPTALAQLKKGETVLDLGSGAGFDVFLAAAKVRPTGKAIGVDMTPEMLERARYYAKKNGIENVEFRLGEIENLPVGDNSVDVVISNCVINLSTDKPRVFQEIYRVLKPGGRIAISDIALLKELPQSVKESVEAYIGCVAGAVHVDEYKKIVEGSGLKDVKGTVIGSSECISPDTKDPLGRAIFLDSLEEGETLEGIVVSINVEGHK